MFIVKNRGFPNGGFIVRNRGFPNGGFDKRIGRVTEAEQKREKLVVTTS